MNEFSVDSGDGYSGNNYPADNEEATKLFIGKLSYDVRVYFV